MDAEIWQAGIQALVTVPDRVEPPEGAREAWLEEARLYQTESETAETPEQAASLLVAAARAAEIGGEPAQAADGYDEALARAPSATDALRARARLAESVGDVDEAHALWARLAIAAGTAEERAFYGALSAEWTLARRGALPAVALDAIPAGAARALAVAEEALRGGTPGAAAGAFAAAGRTLGGPAGAAFLDQAARFALAARDGASATAYRLAARKLDSGRDDGAPRSPAGGRRGGSALGRRAGRRGRGDAAPGSALAQAVGRWAAALARQRGDVAGALALIAGTGATTVAAARDRIDLEIATAAPLDGPSLARLRASATAPAAAANLTWIEAGDLVRQGAWTEAGTLLGRAIEEHGDAVPLALLAEEIATETDDPALEEEALDVWLRGDPARRAEAAFRLAAVREAVGSGLGARAALQTAMESAPESLAFWKAAAADARSGRRSDAAAALDYGAELWGASALVPALRAMAAVKHAPSDPARVLAALGVSGGGALSDAARALGAEALARLAERAGDRQALETALGLAAEQAVDSGQRSWVALRRASIIPAAEGEAHAAALDGAREALSRAPAGRGALARRARRRARGRRFHAGPPGDHPFGAPRAPPNGGVRRGEHAGAGGGSPGRPPTGGQDPDRLAQRSGGARGGGTGRGRGGWRGGRRGAGGAVGRRGGAGRGPRAGHRRGAPRGRAARRRRRGAARAGRRSVRGRRAAGGGPARRRDRPGPSAGAPRRSFRYRGRRRAGGDPGRDRRGGCRALERAGGGARRTSAA